MNLKALAMRIEDKSREYKQIRAMLDTQNILDATLSIVGFTNATNNASGTAEATNHRAFIPVKHQKLIKSVLEKHLQEVEQQISEAKQQLMAAVGGTNETNLDRGRMHNEAESLF